MKAIFQLNVGNRPEYELPLKSMSDYCKRHGIDHIVSTEMKVNKLNFYFEKMQLYEHVSRYTQVAYVDADVIATPNAPNIFHEYSSPTTFYAYDENAPTENMDRDPIVRQLIPFIEGEWPKNNRGQFRYFNAGIFITSPYAAIVPITEIPPTPAISEFGDQTLLNYTVVKKELPFESLDWKWNAMHLGNPDPDGKRFDAHWIHYAGPVVYGDTTKSKQENMEDDYRRLYG